MNATIVSTTATIHFEELKYVAKLDCPEGYRLVRIINKGKDAVSLGAYIPCLTPADIERVMADSKGVQFIRECLESVQDKIARRMVTISDEIGINALIDIDEVLKQIFAESETRGRLSKEAIATWFASDLAPILCTALQTKDLSDDQITQTVKVFSGYFVSLAGRSVSMNAKVKGQLEKAVALLPDSYESEIGERIIARLLDASEATAELDAL